MSKRIIQLFCFVILASSTITSCSIEKRHYLSGYHIEWKSKEKTPAKENSQKEKQSNTENLHGEEQTSKEINETKLLIDKNDINNQESKEQVSTEIIHKEKRTELSLVKNQRISIKQTTNRLHTKTNQFIHKKLALINLSDAAADDIVILVLAIVCIVIGLPFLAIALMVGIGPEFWLNIALLLATVLFLVLAFAAFSSGGLFALFVVLGTICAFAAIIQAIVVVVKNA